MLGFKNHFLMFPVVFHPKNMDLSSLSCKLKSCCLNVSSFLTVTVKIQVRRIPYRNIMPKLGDVYKFTSGFDNIFLNKSF